MFTFTARLFSVLLLDSLFHFILHFFLLTFTSFLLFVLRFRFFYFLRFFAFYLFLGFVVLFLVFLLFFILLFTVKYFKRNAKKKAVYSTCLFSC